MADRLDRGLDALQGAQVPVTWDDVRSRAQEGAGGADGDPPTPLEPAGESGHHGRRRSLAAAAAIVAVIGGLLAAALVVGDGGDAGYVDTGPGPQTTPTTAPTHSGPSTTSEPITTAPPGEVGARRFAVTTWTGEEYLVWSGWTANETPRGDGWRYDPATAATADIPTSPISGRNYASGVWTGEELVVCCGQGARSASAAAYDPATDTWRSLADPPSGAADYTFGAIWTGEEMLVLVQGLEPKLFAYDPADDTWQRRAAPPFGDRFSQSVWTGERLVLWTEQSQGAVYDPEADAWTTLPALPAERSVDRGSVAWADDQIVVWGGDASDDTRTVGYRLRLGEEAWRPMADAPIPPIDDYEGTHETENLTTGPADDQVVVVPTHGYERGAGGVEGPPPTLLTYDPGTDRWRDLEVPFERGLFVDLTVAGGRVLVSDRAEPVVARLPG